MRHHTLAVRRRGDPRSGRCSLHLESAPLPGWTATSAIPVSPGSGALSSIQARKRRDRHEEPGLTAPITSPDQLKQGLTVIGRASDRHPELVNATTETITDCGREGLIAALAIALRLEQPSAILAALTTVIPTTTKLDTLRALSSATPQFSLVLGRIKVLIDEVVVRRVR